MSRRIAIALAVLAGSVYAQTKIATPHFEVASIKPCKDGDFRPGRSGGGGTHSSPGSLIVNCETVASLIPQASLNSAERAIKDPHFVRLLRQPVKGGPSWLDSDLYRIEAKAQDASSDETMRGPMMKALLEDRFQLKIHRDSREIAVYALTVAKGGPRLQAAKEGSCMIVDRDHPFSPPDPGQPIPRICGGIHGTSNGFDTYGQTMTGLCFQLAGRLDREVIDKTGITGMFDMHLEASRTYLFPGLAAEGDQSGAPAAPDPTDTFAAIRAAVQKLGLKLERTKGRDEFLVIDHIERPSEN